VLIPPHNHQTNLEFIIFQRDTIIPSAAEKDEEPTVCIQERLLISSHSNAGSGSTS